MQDDRKLRLEIAHVLFIDLVGYSKLLISEQTEVLAQLKEMVRNSPEARAADSEGKLIRLATGTEWRLIDARSDAHLWAQSYDRELADLFAIQSEIAQTLAE
jgi:hypothetical protein